MKSNTTYKIFEDKVDKLVHDTFANESISTTDNEWQSLNERLHEKSKNNSFKKALLYGALLFMLGAGSTYLYLKNNIKNVNANFENKNNVSNFKTEKNTNPNTTLQNNKALEQIAVTEPEKNTNDYFKPNNLKQETNNYNKQINASKSDFVKGIDKEKNIVFSSQKSNSNTINYKQNFDVSVNTAILTNEKVKSSKIAFDNNKIVENNKADTTRLALEDLINNAIPNNEIIQNNNQSTLNPAKNLANNDENALENNNNNVIIKNTTAKKALKQKRERRAAPEHYFNNDKSIFVEAFSGKNNSIKNTNTFTAFLAPNGYNNMRLQQETALPSVTAGVQFKMRKRHLILSSGLQYLQLGDVVNYDTAFNSSSFVKQANGKTTFSYMELPILAGYEWANKRWGFTLQGGLSTGILTQLKGNYVSIQNFNSQLFDVNQNKGIFRTAIFNVVFSPQIQYYVNDKTNVFAAPTYKRNLQAITKIDADLKQRYQIFGIQIGVRTKLN